MELLVAVALAGAALEDEAIGVPGAHVAGDFWNAKAVVCADSTLEGEGGVVFAKDI